MDISVAILGFICIAQTLVLAFVVSKLAQSNERVEMIKKSNTLEEFTEAVDTVQEIDNKPGLIDRTVQSILAKNKAKEEEEAREKSIFEDMGGESIPNREHL